MMSASGKSGSFRHAATGETIEVVLENGHGWYWEGASESRYIGGPVAVRDQIALFKRCGYVHVSGSLG